MTTLAFAYCPVDPSPAATVYVDGTEPGFRSLSHWPGNTTPPPLKRDLSTGIVLAWAALDEARQQQLLGSFEVVANNHYDTDGVLSVFGMLHPGRALAHADLLLRAAATGDFGTWNGPDALAIDLTVMHLTTAPGSPLGSKLKADADDRERHALGYAWLLDELPAILADPFRHQDLWAERHARIVDDVRAVESGDVRVEQHPDLDLAVVTTTRPLTLVGLHHAAGDRFRVLLVQPGADGNRYRFHYRDESWFELASRQVAPRVALDALVESLNAAEAGAPTATPVTEGARWWATPLQVPVARLHYSDPAGDAHGIFDDPHLASDPPSRLALPDVLTRLATTLRRSAPTLG